MADPTTQKPVFGQPQPKATAPPKPRFKPIDRRQIRWHMIDPEQLISADHPARAIWELTGRLDLSGFEKGIKAVEGKAGQATLHPRLLVSVWVYAYSLGIGSARELSARINQESGLLWLTGFTPINYHTLSDFRVAHREILKQLLSQLLGILQNNNLVDLQRVMLDGTRIRSRAGRRSFRREKGLKRHIAEAAELVEQLHDDDPEVTARQQQARKRSAREQVARLEQAKEQLEEVRRQRKPSERDRAAVSLSEPEARILSEANGGFAAGYNAQVCVDARASIILDAEVTQNGSDWDELEPAMDRVEASMGSQPAQAVVDGGYTKKENIVGMAEREIDLIGSLEHEEKNRQARQRRQGYADAYAPSKFVYDADTDTYRCPEGCLLRHRGQRRMPGKTEHGYAARESDCKPCPHKQECAPNNPRQRNLVRIVDDPEVVAFRQKMQTEDAKLIYRTRGEISEFPNAWIKEKLGLRRFHVFGKTKAQTELLWAVFTYNAQRWIRLCWNERPQHA